MYGMPSGFAELLRRKYDIMQQGVDNQRIGVTAAANLDNTRAGLLPAESRANIAKTNADARYMGVQTDWYDDIAKSEIDLRGTQGRVNLSQVGVNNAQRGLIGANTDEARSSTAFLDRLRMQPFGMPSSSDTRSRLDFLRSQPIRY